MSENSKIEWTDHTFNPWEGCQKVGPGCDHCYAETRNARFGGGMAINWGPGAPRRRTSVSNWNKPKAWNAAHAEFFAKHGRRQRVFCASLADWLDKEAPVEWLVDLLSLIRATPHLDWLLLTKRIGNFDKRIKQAFGHAQTFRTDDTFWQWIAAWGCGDEVPPNAWLGATIVNQEEADRDIPKLLAVPAAKRFLSMEPLLGPVELTDLVQKVGPGEHHYSALDCDVDPADDEWNGATVDWVIVGGESGPGARPMHPDWARSLRDQCAAAGVPFLFKQWGEWAPHRAGAGGDEGGDLRRGHVRYLQGDCREPDGTFRRGDAAVARVGKKAAGRLLNGITHDGFPQ